MDHLLALRLRTLTVRLRTLAVWVTATAAALGLGRALVLDLRGAGATPVDAETALSALCEVALVACLVWVWVATTVVVVEVVLDTARSTAMPGIPQVWRRWVLLACGAALAAGLAAPAQATPGSVHLDPDGRDTDPAPSMAGLAMPDRPVGRRHPVPASAPTSTPAPAPARVGRGGAPAPGAVTVRAGDSLWSIAAADLGPTADRSAIAARWRAVYLANRDVLGPDPDLIVPGQHLELPPP